MTLELDRVSAAYGSVAVLHDVSFTVAPGEVTCLLGRNGAGKTTVLRTIAGLLPLSDGHIAFEGRRLDAVPAERLAAAGIALVPQGRRLFGELTVAENLEIGLMAHRDGRAAHRRVRERVLEMFPRLRERLKQRAVTLSGGEQQMLATARALSVEPRVLLLDEPTEGLQPSIIALIGETVRRLRDDGVAVLLVEQRIDAVMALADRAVLIETGSIVDRLSREDLQATPGRLEAHLGV